MKKIIQTIYNGFTWIIDVLLFGQWVKFWDWIKDIHASTADASSKRVYGGIMVLSAVGSFLCWGKGWFPLETFTGPLYAAWTLLLIIGSGMISIEVLIKLAEVIAKLKGEKKTGINE